MNKELKNLKNPNEILKNVFEGNIEYPIDLNTIVKKCGLTIKSFDQKIKIENDEEIWGFLDLKNKIIGISKYITYLNTKRFTIAHELGHFFLDENKNNFYLRSKNGAYEAKEERRYNNFAMNLLVLSDKKFTINKEIYSESELANLYGVPLSLIEHINYFKRINHE